jgi:hypothetical protein
MKTVFVDMDGVLTNFEKRYTEVIGMTPFETRQARDKKEFSVHWETFIRFSSFEHLEWFPGAQELVAFLNKQPVQKCILSSSGGMKFHNQVMLQKQKWLRVHNIDWPVVIVPGRRYKAGFASSSTALIDDTPDVIQSFIKRGGLGILHKPTAKWETTFTIEEWLK